MGFNMRSSSRNGDYTAGAFNKGLPGGKTPGKLSVGRGYLVFESRADAIRLPLAGISVKRGGAGRRLFFFTHPDVPGWTVYTPEREILRDFQIAHLPVVQDVQNQINRSRVWLTAAVIAVALAITVSGYGVVKLKAPLTRAVADRIPITWEEKIGDMMIAQLKSRLAFIENRQLLSMLESVFTPLSEHISDTGYEFNLHVAKNPAINAFALPGGDIVLHTG